MRRITFILMLLMITGCMTQSKRQEKQLEAIADSINTNLIAAKDGLLKLQVKAESLFFNEEKNKNGYYKNRVYEYFKTKNDSVYYNPNNDGANAVWVSILHRLNPEEKIHLNILEFLEADMKKNVEDNKFVVQSYFQSYFSALSCYPFFDVITYLTPKLDFAKDFKSYYLADTDHNPERKEIWLTPYLDVSGNGYMISVIVPVYRNDKLLGVLGNDLPLSRIDEYYLSKTEKKLIVITDSTLVISANKSAVDFLKIELLKELFFTERAKTGVLAPEDFKLIEYKNVEIKDLAKQLLAKRNNFETTLNNQRVKIISKEIPLLKWYLIEIIDK